MNKELLDQVQQAMQAQQDTIARQKWMIEQREQEIEIKESRIAQLTTSLNQLAKAQAQELQALPTLFNELKNSLNGTIIEYQNWLKAQKLRQKAQVELATELVKVANRQLELTKALTSYQRDIPSLEALETDTIKLESELSKLAKSQSQISSSASLLTTTQSEIESQIVRVNKLLDGLQSK